MSRWRVPLPKGAEPPLQVFVNGVPQEQGKDYELVGRELLFDRPLEKERLSKGKWTAIFFGLWGYYGKNDSVDVQYRVGGQETVATGLEIIPPEGPAERGCRRKSLIVIGKLRHRPGISLRRTTLTRAC